MLFERIRIRSKFWLSALFQTRVWDNFVNHSHSHIYTLCKKNRGRTNKITIYRLLMPRINQKNKTGFHQSKSRGKAAIKTRPKTHQRTHLPLASKTVILLVEWFSQRISKRWRHLIPIPLIPKDWTLYKSHEGQLDIACKPSTTGEITKKLKSNLLPYSLTLFSELRAQYCMWRNTVFAQQSTLYKKDYNINTDHGAQ